MKAVILAGGLGTRIGELTHSIPKPMIDIGGKPILWHIMKTYHYHGINDFIICAGYKSYVIKEYFANYFMHMSDVTFDHQKNQVIFHESSAEKWKVTVIDTGVDTMTGGRLQRIKKYLDRNKDFLMTYGDGVSNIDIKSLIRSHKESKKLATISVSAPPARFGAVSLDGSSVKSFIEKPVGDGSLINMGYFVLNYAVLDYITNDNTVWEQEPLVNLVKDQQLNAFKHNGFWQPMDTLRDRNLLQKLWSEKPVWKVW